LFRSIKERRIFNIRPLAGSDCDEILRINGANRPSVAALDRAELARLLALGVSGHVVVAEDGAIAGYMLVFARGSEYDGEEYRYFSTQLREDFLYVDQVAIDSARQRSGAGRRCYEALTDEAKARGIALLCCEVNTVPPNPASLEFHQRLGFTVIGNGDTLDGRRVAFLSKKI
jgi:predicted GNAT superfamily acetyltransferase